MALTQWETLWMASSLTNFYLWTLKISKTFPFQVSAYLYSHSQRWGKGDSGLPQRSLALWNYAQTQLNICQRHLLGIAKEGPAVSAEAKGYNPLDPPERPIARHLDEWLDDWKLPIRLGLPLPPWQRVALLRKLQLQGSKTNKNNW